MNKYKKIFLILFLLILYIIISAYSYSVKISNDISKEVFRLHVIANSDSEEDQNLKYIIRDNLINYMNTLTQDSKTKEDAILLAQEHSDDFYKIANNTIKNLGYNYDVKINIGNYHFPTKYYGDISLPAGNYDALKVEIGEAKGQNWWCVMFPPLCFIDISTGIVPDESKEYLKENLTNEEFSLVSDNKNNNINFKFKIIELFNK